jgi:hypothetical protein
VTQIPPSAFPSQPFLSANRPDRMPEEKVRPMIGVGVNQVETTLVAAFSRSSTIAWSRRWQILPLA